MNILFVCTSNKDRSPALEDYFRHHLPEYEYESAGINKFFTQKKGTTYINQDHLSWANLIVFAEDVHYEVVKRNFPNAFKAFLRANNHEKDFLILNCGEYTQGAIEEDYLVKAYIKVQDYLDIKQYL